MSDSTGRFDSWAVVELMGHVRTAGRVTEEERFGARMGRVDIPKTDGGFVTVYFGGSSVYRLTPCSEDAARAVARDNQPEPVHRWELPNSALDAIAARRGHREFGDAFIPGVDDDGGDSMVEGVDF